MLEAIGNISYAGASIMPPDMIAATLAAQPKDETIVMPDTFDYSRDNQARSR